MFPEQVVKERFDIAPIFRLRWRMEFTDGTRKFGGWDSASTKLKEMAAYQNTSNVARVIIEGEKAVSWEVETLAEMDGQDFIQFKWMAAGRVPGGGFSQVSQVVPSMLTGMMIVGRYKTAIVLKNGRGTIVDTPESAREGFVDAYRK